MQEQAGLQAKRDAERSAREAAEAQLKLDNEERIRRLAAFQALAADRMHKQQTSLGPLMVNLKQSHAELTEAENLQVCGMHDMRAGSCMHGSNAQERGCSRHLGMSGRFIRQRSLELHLILAVWIRAL